MDGLLADADRVVVVVPRDTATTAPAWAAVRELLALEHGELEVECGAPVTTAGAVPDRGAVLELRTDAAATAPSLTRRGERHVVVTGRDVDDVVAGLSLLRTARRTGARTLVAAPADGVGDACDRVEAEVATTCPSLALRSLDWSSICAEHGPGVDPDDPLPGLQRWVARLGDAHTAVRPTAPPLAPLPLTARRVGAGILVVEVAEGSVADAAGVGPGWSVLDVDVAALRERWGATPQNEPWLTGRRACSGRAGEPTALRYRSPDGRVVGTSEVPGATPWHDHLAVDRLPSGTGYLRLRRWSVDDLDAIDDALASLAGCERLLVDLRGNPGGELVAAASFRARFVPTTTRLGSVRYAVGDGGVSSPFPVVAEPSARVRWPRRVRFVVDGLTYSASEDAIQGLQQLDTVDVVGAVTGGGSGRPRTVPLLPGIELGVSTALTFDHEGACIEGRGLVPDTPLDLPPGPTGVRLADRDW